MSTQNLEENIKKLRTTIYGSGKEKKKIAHVFLIKLLSR